MLYSNKDKWSSGVLMLSPVTGAPHSWSHHVPAAGSWPRLHRAVLTGPQDDKQGQTLEGYINSIL